MSKFKTILISLALVFALSASAFANGLSLNSVGAKALGMGGAFVGLANDGSAIYWNPAGLSGQESSVSGYYTGIMPNSTYKNEMFGIDATAKSVLHSTGGLFANYTMDKWAFGLGVYVPAGLGVEWEGEDLSNLTAPFGFPGPYEYMSQIGVITFSPAVAYQISEQFSLGLSVNINYAMFDMKRPGEAMDVSGNGTLFVLPQYSEESTGMGYGVTLGLMWDINKQFSLGASFRSASSVTMSGTAEITDDLPLHMESDFDRDITWPMWIAGGIAYKPTCGLTLTFDAQYSQWSELDKLTTDYATFPDEGGEFHLDWIDATQIRLGAEYMASKVSAIRLGYYYDPAPAPDATLNILFPSSTNHVITAGYGYSNEKIFIDFGMEYLFGQERDISADFVNDDPTQGFVNEMPGIHQMDIIAFGISFGYKF